MEGQRAGVYILIILCLILALSQAGGLKNAAKESSEYTNFGTSPEDGESSWSYALNGSTSSPLVVDDTVYIGGFGADFWASYSTLDDEYLVRDVQAHIYAFNSGTGELRWKSETNESIIASPEYSNGTVYIGDLSGVIYAINSTSGEEIWRFKSPHPVYSSPSAYNGSVYYGTRDYSAHSLAEDNRFFLYSLSADDGEVRWKKRMDQGVFASPTVVNGTVYVGDQNGTAYAIDAVTGQAEWSFDVSGNKTAKDPARKFGSIFSPRVSDGEIYIPSYNGNIYALDLGTGEEVWESSVGGLVASSPEVKNNSIYIGNYEGEITSLNKSTGEIRWKRNVSKWRISKSSPIVSDDAVIFGGTNGKLYSVRVEDGGTLWTYNATSPILSSPAVADGRIYFSTSDKFYAVAQNMTLNYTKKSENRTSHQKRGRDVLESLIERLECLVSDITVRVCS